MPTLPETEQSAPSAPPQRAIHWGGVLKGVAIVAAVVVAGVVAYSVIGSIAGYATTAINASPAASSLVEGASQTVAALWINVQSLAGTLWGNLELAGGWALKTVGFEGLKWGGAAAATQTAAVIGAGAATAVAAHAAIPALHNLQTTTDVPVDAGAVPPDAAVTSGLFAAQGANATHAASLHELTHAAHHAADSTDEHAHKMWAAQFANKAAFASHSDAVRASQAERTITARNDNFAEQLNADRANLDAALAK